MIRREAVECLTQRSAIHVLCSKGVGWDSKTISDPRSTEKKALATCGDAACQATTGASSPAAAAWERVACTSTNAAQGTMSTFDTITITSPISAP